MRATIQTLIILFITQFTTQGQSTDLFSDSLFFYEQERNYQSWLNDVGLGEALSTDGIQIYHNKIALHLKLQTSSADTAYWLFQRIVKDFGDSSPFSMEQTLLYRMISIMEIRPPEALIILRNRTEYGQLPSIDYRIFYDPATNIVVMKGTLRSIIRDSILLPAFILNTKINQQKQLNTVHDFTNSKLYKLKQKLGEKFVEHFSGKTEPRFVVKLCQNPLICEVMNVKGEVVPTGYFNILDPNERLVFTVEVRSERKGLHIVCMIDGKYGSGLFRPRTVKAYRDMVPEYAGELARYSQQFTQILLPEWIMQIINDEQ